MKKYNKILEAIQKGINIALDDFEDTEIQTQKDSKLIDKNLTKEYIDLTDTIIDLGLPSGTLWCKYNLGVNQNQLFKPEDWYGGYYAWGETETKGKYTWETYEHCTPDYDPQENENEGSLTKYTGNVFIGSDGKTILEAEDDAAYQNMHCYDFKFHIPTKEELEELIALPNKWVKDYNGISGLNGRVFTGTNGNTLFIPAAGLYTWISPYKLAGSDGFLWSSSLGPYNDIMRAWNLQLYLPGVSLGYYIRSFRCFGFPIRPVINVNDIK